MLIMMAYFLGVCLIILLAINDVISLQSSGLGSADEVRLLNDLFSKQGYNPLIRPVRNINDTVKVDFNMALIQLINVDEKNQILKTNVWLRMVWHDYQLEWDPYDYGGISVIRMLSQEVWKPDIVLFNNADGKYEVSYKSNVVLSHTGEVLWIPPAIYQSSCTIHVEYFPFDEQECEMKFGSWTFNGDQVVLGWYDGKEKIDLSDYVNSGTWDVMSVPGVSNNSWDETDGHHKSHITYTLKIRRKTLFYTVNLIIPCVLISFLSVSVFLLPADAHEKMTMCISILLALVVFLLLVSKILPPTSLTIPLIAKYLLFTFIMNICTIVFTVIIINWNFRTPRTHRMQKLVRNIFLNYLPRIIHVKRPDHDRRYQKKPYSIRHESIHARQEFHQKNQNGSMREKRSKNGSHDPYQPYSIPNVHKLPKYNTNMDGGTNNKGSRTFGVNFGSPEDMYLNMDSSLGETQIPQGRSEERGMTEENFPPYHMTGETHKAIEAVRFIAAHLRNEDEYGEVLEDWRYTALVIDRLLFLVFISITILGTITILLNAPHIFEYVDQNKIIEDIIKGKDGYPQRSV